MPRRSPAGAPPARGEGGAAAPDPRAAVVFLNGAVARAGGRYLLPANEAGFYGELARHYARVEIVGDVERVSDTGGMVPADEVPGVHVVPLADVRTPWLRRTRSSLAALAVAERRLARGSDLYLYFPGRVGTVVGLALALRRRRYALYVRNDVRGLPPAVRRLCVGRAAFCVATGREIEKQVREHSARVEMVVPMMNVGPADLAAPRAADGAGPRRIVFIGQLTPSKGVETVFEVARELERRGVPAEARVIGGGPAEYVEQLRHALPAGAGGRPLVRLLGSLGPERIREELLAADVFLFPTRYNEGFPRVLYEAMTLGAPVVTTRLELFSWLLRDGGNAALCEPEPAAYAAAVARLLEDPAHAEALRAGARESMRQLFAQLPATTHAGQVVSRFGRAGGDGGRGVRGAGAAPAGAAGPGEGGGR